MPSPRRNAAATARRVSSMVSPNGDARVKASRRRSDRSVRCTNDANPICMVKLIPRFAPRCARRSMLTARAGPRMMLTSTDLTPLMDTARRGLTLDLIIPIYNEAEVLELLFGTLEATFSRENLVGRNIAGVRYLFVDCLLYTSPSPRDS